MLTVRPLLPGGACPPPRKRPGCHRQWPHWLLARRALQAGEKGDLELAFYRFYSPRPVTLAELAAVGGKPFTQLVPSGRELGARSEETYFLTYARAICPDRRADAPRVPGQRPTQLRTEGFHPETPQAGCSPEVQRGAT